MLRRSVLVLALILAASLAQAQVWFSQITSNPGANAVVLDTGNLAERANFYFHISCLCSITNQASVCRVEIEHRNAADTANVLDPGTGLPHTQSMFLARGVATGNEIGTDAWPPVPESFPIPVAPNESVRVRNVNAITTGTIVCSILYR